MKSALPIGESEQHLFELSSAKGLCFEELSKSAIARIDKQLASKKEV